MIDSSCPRFSENEDWDHVMKCRYAEGKRDDHSAKLKTRLMKSDYKNEYLIKINKIVSDMSKFLIN